MVMAKIPIISPNGDSRSDIFSPKVLSFKITRRYLLLKKAPNLAHRVFFFSTIRLQRCKKIFFQGNLQDKKSFHSFVPELVKMETQEKILKAALALFFKYGIKRVTMDDIAKELGMSKKTIYQFYKEKDDLVNQLCELQLVDQENGFHKMNEEAKDPIHEIMLISLRMKEMMQNINPVFFLDLQKYYPTAFKRFQKFKEDCAYKYVLINIKRGKELGVYRADLDVEFTARYRLAQIDMLMFGGYFSYEKISFTKTSELILDLFAYGICTMKGHKLINNYKKIKEEEE